MENAAAVIAGLAIAAVLIAVFVVVFRWLWNTTMPEVFGLKTLSFGQALKILLLAAILFGSHRVVQVSQEVASNGDHSVDQLR
ncbi:MAG: hypothetical protein H6953_00575 [Chromatiaceae bacterium]|nr:hypothetical protein [Gammaproteobacteria bacterium]MCP5303911.1 hypothetical protein [Chromatiaceae bacterium]MCP5313638.1 hypothetical protein [Chromatiaceae bacterium]